MIAAAGATMTTMNANMKKQNKTKKSSAQQAVEYLQEYG